MAVDLSDKKVLVNGAAGGLGAAMALALANGGARVAAVDLPGDGLEALAGENANIAALPADLSDVATCSELIDRARTELGGLTGLVNNAGVGLSSIREDYYARNIMFWEVPVERWQKIFDVNARAAFLLSRAAAPDFLEQGWGHIVNVTTSMDTMIRRGWTPYGPSKAALEAQSACWAKDVDGTGVTVNVLVPGGPANTGMVPPASSPDRAAMIQPSVMQAPVCWLMSSDSDGFNGKRLTGAGWDSSLNPRDAAEAAAAPAAWPGAGQQSIWPDGAPDGDI